MNSSAECRCREAPGSRILLFLNFALLGAVTVCASACQRQAADTAAKKPRPQHAGQPLNPTPRLAIAPEPVRRFSPAINRLPSNTSRRWRDLSRSARLRDTSRPINHEAARAALRPIPGVHSVLWIDADNLAVMVDGQQYRDMDMIDRLCVALEALVDTLGVVVNLQDAKARNGDEATMLSRDCRLPEGQKALI